ncbi:MAG: hypothetical protein V3T28_00830 [Gemmatimonadales bacterium]
MTYALMSSGGKDCTLAFDRAKRDGYDVRYLANIYEGTTDRVRFHGVRKELVRAQAEAMGLEPILSHTTPHDFEPVFVELLDELKRRGCRGVIFGNIHLADVRAWYEERVTRSGLEHVELLWGEPPMELVYEVVERGYHGLLVSVDLAAPAAHFLGRELDADLLTDIGITDDLDPCGERGEFHTFIYDGPEFRHAVAFDRGETLEIEGHRFIDLLPLQAR